MHPRYGPGVISILRRILLRNLFRHMSYPWPNTLSKCAICHFSAPWNRVWEQNGDFTQLASACKVSREERMRGYQKYPLTCPTVLPPFLFCPSSYFCPWDLLFFLPLLIFLSSFVFPPLLSSMQLLWLLISSFPLSTAFFLFPFSSASPPFLPPSPFHFRVPSSLSISSASLCFICYLLLCHLGKVK